MLDSRSDSNASSLCRRQLSSATVLLLLRFMLAALPYLFTFHPVMPWRKFRRIRGHNTHFCNTVLVYVTQDGLVQNFDNIRVVFPPQINHNTVRFCGACTCWKCVGYDSARA